MRAWLSAAEIAQLPGLPQTTRGVHLHAKRRGWGKTKKVGNRLYYHQSLLPQPLLSQPLLPQPLLSQPLLPLAADEAETRELPPAAESASAAKRRKARLWLLQKRDEFRRRNHLGETAATAGFCEAWNAARVASAGWARKLVKRISPPTMRRWLKMRMAGDMVGLGGNYGAASRGTLTLGNAIGRAAAALALKNPALTSDHIRDYLAGKGYSPPSARAVSRFLAKLRRQNREAVLAITDPDGFRGRMRLVGNASGGRYAKISKPNELWEIDASPADVLLSEGRHSLYVVIDAATRRLLALATKTPRTQAALLLVRKAITAWGVPEMLRTDNGKDFVSHQFKHTLAAIGIAHELCPPFSPERKGLVERHIRTIQHGLMPLLPGYIGHDVAERQRIREQSAFAKRLGEGDNVFRVEMSRGKFQETLDAWLEYKYQHRPHQGLRGRTPFQAATSHRGRVKRLGSERVLDLLLAPLAGMNGWRTVTKRGVRADGKFYQHGALIPGDKVFCRHDPDDLGRLFVWDANERFICEATDPVYAGIDPGKAIAAVRGEQKRRIKTATATIRRDMRNIPAGELHEVIIGSARAASGNIRVFPTPAEQHQTPAIIAAEEADKKRRAAAMLAGLEVPKVAAMSSGERPYFGHGEDLQWAKWLMAHPTRITASDLQRLYDWLQNSVNAERVSAEEWDALAALVEGGADAAARTA